MKQNGLMFKMPDGEFTLDEAGELFGEQHIGNTCNTPLRNDAFDLNDQEKIQIISGHFREIMYTLGLDLKDDSLKGTPSRVAKMYVEEIYSGLDPKNKPIATLFDNKYRYNQMLKQP